MMELIIIWILSVTVALAFIAGALATFGLDVPLAAMT